MGLTAPSAGEASVLGRPPSPEPRVPGRAFGYLAQDVPLYNSLTTADHLQIGAHLNHVWDADRARARLAGLRIPDDQPVATLSGGQRAQVALSMALAKRPGS